MKQIPQEVLQRLDALAAKLGIGAEYLFDLFVRQQYLDFYYALIIMLVGLMILGPLSFVSIKIYQKQENWFLKEEKIRWRFDDLKNTQQIFHVIRIAFIILSGIMLVGGFIGTIVNSYDLTNPQLFAFNEMIKQLKHLVP